MPIFEYQCRACGEKAEKIQRQPEESIPCPACGQTAKRVLSVFATAGNAAPAGCPSGGCASGGGSGFR